MCAACSFGSEICGGILARFSELDPRNIYIYMIYMYRKGIPGLHEPQATGTNPEISSSSWMISFC